MSKKKILDALNNYAKNKNITGIYSILTDTEMMKELELTAEDSDWADSELNGEVKDLTDSGLAGEDSDVRAAHINTKPLLLLSPEAKDIITSIRNIITECLNEGELYIAIIIEDKFQSVALDNIESIKMDSKKAYNIIHSYNSDELQQICNYLVRFPSVAEALDFKLGEEEINADNLKAKAQKFLEPNEPEIPSPDLPEISSSRKKLSIFGIVIGSILALGGIISLALGITILTSAFTILIGGGVTGIIVGAAILGASMYSFLKNEPSKPIPSQNINPEQNITSDRISLDQSRLTPQNRAI